MVLVIMPAVLYDLRMSEPDAEARAAEWAHLSPAERAQAWYDAAQAADDEYPDDED